MRLGWTAIAVIGLSVAACTSGDGASDGQLPADGVRIASFDFAESEILAELYAQTLESVDVPVIRLGVVGPREVVAPSLQLDRLDLVPEYLGTALQFFGATTTDPETSSPATSLQTVLAGKGLSALEPSPAQDANAVIVTAEFAETHDATSISDLAGSASELRFGGPVECPERPLCLIGLAEVYGLTFAEFVPQRSIGVTVEALRRNEIDVGLAFTTSPELADTAFVVLADDLGLQPEENIIPVIRQSALDAWGTSLVDALNDLSAALTTADVRAMNRLVDDGASVDDVAADWLAEHGFASLRN
jgi:osmoprotectant transport system substrate-binding protein